MSRIAWFFLVCVPPLSAALLAADGRPPLTKEAPARRGWGPGRRRRQTRGGASGCQNSRAARPGGL